MLCLVDANSFYASAEAVFRPEWRNKPIVILSNNDGCVVALNRKAKEAGVPKFEPYFKIKALCELKNIVVLSSNYTLYSTLSMNMMNTLARFAPEQHIYSIDECFLDFRGTSKAIPNLYEYGLNIRRSVWKDCRLPVSLGFASTITLTKVASRIAKERKELQGVCVIATESQRLEYLASLKVGDVWGVGRKISERLKFMGVNTALDLAKMEPKIARKEFSVNIEKTVHELNGVPCYHWDSHERRQKQQIYSTRSVGERITDIELLKEAVAKHCATASKKARAQSSLCKTMVVFAGNSPFDGKHVSRQLTYKFEYPTADVTKITKVAMELVDEIFIANVNYYKIGVGLIELVDGEHVQGDLFNDQPDNTRLMSVIDRLNLRYGGDTLFLCAQGIEQKWEMKREMLTPNYCNNWSSIPKIRC